MDWSTLVFGVVLGSCVTSALIWMLLPRGRANDRRELIWQIGLSVALTAILGGLARTGIEYGSSGVLTMAGALFGTGWLIGGLVAGWFLVGSARKS